MALRILLGGPLGPGIPEGLLRAAVEAALRSAEVEDAEISLAILPDEPIRSLNREWLGHDWVPDVLSFGLHDEGDPPIGDIYIGSDQAARQAEELGVTFEEELVRLAVHGTLHVLGGHHPDSKEGREGSPFFVRQEALVSGVMAGQPTVGPRGSGPSRPDPSADPSATEDVG